MKELLRPQAPFYYVVYEDHTGEGGNKPLGEKNSLSIIQCAGFLVYEDKRQVVIALDIWCADDPPTYCHEANIKTNDIIVMYQIDNPVLKIDNRHKKRFRELLTELGSNF